MFKLEYPENGNFFYATRLSAGFDICANEDMTIPAGEWKGIGTGLYIKWSLDKFTLKINRESHTIIPELQLRPRSGLATKFGITMLGAPATIDADYRGEIKVPLINLSKTDYHVLKGDRIAQGVCALVSQLACFPVKDVVRGENGFGSTGVKE